MRAHVTAAEALRAALVRGDMEAFRGAASDLTSDDRADEVWDVNLDVLRAAARRARDAEDTARGAETLAQIGDACSHCHVMIGAPKVPIPAEPTSDSGTRSRMGRHAWAATALWIGLTVPSAEAWRRGALILDQELETAEFSGPGVSPEIVDLAAQARRAAAEAQMAHPDQRRDAFAEVMSTCAPCHAAMGAAPP